MIGRHIFQVMRLVDDNEEPIGPVGHGIPDRVPKSILAPIAGTRVLAPYRVAVPTPIGTGVMQATQFVSTPQPGKPRTSAKAQ